MHDSGEDIDIRNFVSTEFLYHKVILFQRCNFLFCFKQFLHKFTYRFKHIHENCFSPIYICMISTSFTSKHEQAIPCVPGLYLRILMQMFYFI